MNQAIGDSKKNMEKTLEHMKHEFGKLRVGRRQGGGPLLVRRRQR